jgi:hypothetical protein
MIYALNKHFSFKYKLLWLNCINELMNSWLNKFCLGFMSLPLKPHPFGNKYHSIADVDSGKPFMWQIRIIEGKDQTM